MTWECMLQSSVAYDLLSGRRRTLITGGHTSLCSRSRRAACSGRGRRPVGSRLLSMFCSSLRLPGNHQLTQPPPAVARSPENAPLS